MIMPGPSMILGCIMIIKWVFYMCDSNYNAKFWKTYLWSLRVILGTHSYLLTSWGLFKGWSYKTVFYKLLIILARCQRIIYDRWTFSDEIGTFWYLVSKKYHNHSVIIHLVRLWRSENVKIWKIHWKLKYS